MDSKRIRSFIDKIIYDLQTMEFLKEYGRIKETIPILFQVLERIRSFKGQLKDEKHDLNGIFLESFWDEEFSANIKMGDVLAKIEELAKSKEFVLDKDLQDLEYPRFVEMVRVWTLDNIYLLRQFIKSPQRKMVESAVKVLSILVIGGCIAAIILVKVFIHDWGLKGDFYEGENFDKHISTGYNMAINFKNYLEMNPLMPRHHSSARWQGFLAVPKEGEYTFFIKVNGGMRLFIDGKVLMDEWHDNNSGEFSKKMFLSRGKHWLSLEYNNNLKESVLGLYWALKDGKKEIIPAWNLKSKSELFASADGSTAQVLIFAPQDVESGAGWIQKLPDNHPSWPTKDHLLASNPNGLVSVVKNFVIPQQGRYLVMIFHDSAKDFVDAQVRISSVNSLSEPMQTWSSSPIYGQDIYICEFPAGKNSIHIFGKGNPKKRYLGVNSIVIKPF